MTLHEIKVLEINANLVEKVDCKTVRIFAYSGSSERAVKQKVWNEAENRERDWGETFTPRFTDFFTDFEKKTDCFAVYGKRFSNKGS